MTIRQKVVKKTPTFTFNDIGLDIKIFDQNENFNYYYTIRFNFWLSLYPRGTHITP